MVDRGAPGLRNLLLLALALASLECGAERSPQDAAAGTTGAAAGSDGAGAGQNPSTGGAQGGVSMGGSAGGSTPSGGSAGASSSAGTAGASSRTNILHVTFEAQSLGPYSAAGVAADFGVAPPWNDGLDQGRASIHQESENKFLRVTYPAGQFGPAEGGVQFKVTLGGNYDELFFSYRVRFASGFDFVKGGKLPGLVGGTSPTGCSPEPNGFSARNMWRSGGAAVQYVYYPTQPNSCGDDLDYTSAGAPKFFVPDTWQTVEHRILMNTPGIADGVIEAWIDGERVLSEGGHIWRNAGATFAIDTLYFSTFFGGGDATWAPAAEQRADFDDLVVADGPISH